VDGFSDLKISNLTYAAPIAGADKNLGIHVTLPTLGNQVLMAQVFPESMDFRLSLVRTIT
jgi:hypothetical protein